MKSKLTVLAMIAFVAASAAFFFWPKDQTSLVEEATAERILTHVKDLNKPLVLMNFWASWCEPCKEEFPLLLNVREKFKDKGVEIVFVSVDDRDDLPAAEFFLQNQKVDFLTFYKGKQPLSFVSKIFPKWTGAVPASVIFDKDLQIVDAWEGDATQEEFESRLEKHL